VSIFDDEAGPIRASAVFNALRISFGLVNSSLHRLFAQNRRPSGTISPRRMADGKQRTTRNLDVDTMPSYCY
jgi:hypothetical protein